MTDEIKRLIEEIKAIKDNPEYMPKSMQEVYNNAMIITALDKAILELGFAIEPGELATDMDEIGAPWVDITEND